MAFQSVEHLISCSQHQPLWRAVLLDDCQDRDVTEQDSFSRMGSLWQAMVESVEHYDPQRRSASGLSGGQGAKMVGAHNACMGRIVAAPTAGASGVMPAVLLPLWKREGLSTHTMVECLYVAAGFGQVIATRASISGAEGGCQAEIGSASGMAAAALVHARGGTPDQMAAACAMALQNVLGLVCDPVAGLVEVPCVKRNVMGAVNAMACADMALAGIVGVIPCDQVIDAMNTVGRSLPAALRETGKGGLAATPTGRAIAQKHTAPAP